MKRRIQALCALLACGAAVAFFPAEAAQVVELNIRNTEAQVETQTIVLEEYTYQSLAGIYSFQQYLKLDTPVNRISMGGELVFTAMEDDVSIYVSVLTDLNGNGYYEWLDSTGAEARHLLASDGTLVAGNTKHQTVDAGEERTLSAAQLLAAGIQGEQARMADGVTPLYGISLVDSGTLLYCVSLEGGTGSAQSYYFQLDYTLDTTTDVTLLGAGVFDDVPSWAWYWDEVDWAVRQGTMNGVSATQFYPDGDTTRGALMQVLYLQAGAPDVELADFADVVATDWYADAVSWGYDRGLVSGYSDGKFYPNTALTREQLAVIVYNAVKQGGGAVSQTTDLYGFSDGATTSSWASTAVRWAVAVGILDAEDGGLLNPQGTVSRANLAAVLMAIDEM